MNSPAGPWMAASRETPLVRRGPLLVSSFVAALGGAAIPAVTLPPLWRMWQLHAMVFGLLALIETVAVVALWSRPTRRAVLFGAASAGAWVVVWLAGRGLGKLGDPDPWQPADAVFGATDYLAAGLQAVAALGLLIAATGDPRPPSLAKWIASWIVGFPLLIGTLVVSAAGVTAASDGFTGTGVPGDAVIASALPAGQTSTVEYCRPQGVPLPMDLHMPARREAQAPVVLSVHGGEFVLGGRKATGPGAWLAKTDGTLFGQLTARGFVVASIDYRLAPAAPWPAQLTDAKCAVRFLKAHAGALGIDPARISAWGGSLAALVGTAPGFDEGQYLGQSSSVKSVVVTSGIADYTRLDGADRLTRALVHIGLGAEARRAASPATYAAAATTPVLNLHGAGIDSALEFLGS
ncbi:alpha/beta hydrolase fold domain-containing protein [Amycolatopsis sp. cg5]|uniref:alpha/beta hydrolase fold domain-containing protein n=1 Tax=Amycolatopsis sp. cg5 TaxID=3238802 RepID=UPI0035239398